MADKYTYLLILLASLLVPFVFSFHRRLRFDRQWRAFWPACLITAALFIAWDAWFTARGVWGFNPRYILGFYIFGLPLEEVLFFIVIPYASVFTYHCFQLLLPGAARWNPRPLSAVLVVLLLAGGLIFVARPYTSLTFFALAVLTGLLQFVLREKFLAGFYFMYLVILLPFFIVNGLLTGTGVDEPVVWYSEGAIMGFRLLSIPVEDVFYGMLLLLLNVFLYERLKGKAT